MRNKKIAVGFLIGASIGAMAALLLSPDKGSETRQKILDTTSDWGNAFKDSVTDLFKNSKKAAQNGANHLSKKMNLNTMG